jgi:predicted DNA-binding transcriptional regulator
MGRSKVALLLVEMNLIPITTMTVFFHIFVSWSKLLSRQIVYTDWLQIIYEKVTNPAKALLEIYF